jgi:hypothetical protein
MMSNRCNRVFSCFSTVVGIAITFILNFKRAPVDFTTVPSALSHYKRDNDFLSLPEFPA